MEKQTKQIEQTLSVPSVWALAMGSSVGWGVFIMSGTTFLPIAGPLGSLIGMLIGIVIMIIISANYSFMIERIPESGGTYAFARTVFGYDHGFLVGWFLALAYISMLWANATALQLFSRILLNDLLEFGFHYTVAGFEVYFGEIAAISALVILFAWICSRHRKIAAGLITAFAVCLVVCILILCFAAAPSITMRPAFSEGEPALFQIIKIVCLTPWAFIGFESVSHTAPEYRFPTRKSFPVMAVSLVTSGLLYILLTLLSSSAVPAHINSWKEYALLITELNHFNRVPSFAASYAAMGNNGLILISIAVLCAVFTSFIGMFTASSRLYLAMAEDGILPEWFSRRNDQEVPVNAILACAVVSCLILFLGRTAIEWVVDITTMGCAIAYGYTSLSAYRIAGMENRKLIRFTGLLGIILSVWFGFNFMFPSVMSAGALAPETYLILTIWLVIGFLFFRSILMHDTSHKFGNSIIVWLFFMILAYGASYNWIRESTASASHTAVNNLSVYYASHWGIQTPSEIEYLNSQLEQINRALNLSSLLQLATMVATIIIFFNVYTILHRREQDAAQKLGTATDSLHRDPLTGVKSKYAHTEKRKQLIHRIRSGDTKPFAIVVCDLNGLKQINDKYGHATGDRYIQNGASIICKIFKHSPVYRIGGDEFVVLLEGDDYENRTELLESLAGRIEENIKNNDVVLAWGMSEFNPETDRDSDSVFVRADQAMYRKKQELKQS